MGCIRAWIYLFNGLLHRCTLANTRFHQITQTTAPNNCHYESRLHQISSSLPVLSHVGGSIILLLVDLSSEYPEYKWPILRRTGVEPYTLLFCDILVFDAAYANV